MGNNHWIDDFYPDDWNSLEFPEDCNNPHGSYEEAMLLVARRVYDFACHVTRQNVLVAHGDMSKIPDMSEWTRDEQFS